MKLQPDCPHCHDVDQTPLNSSVECPIDFMTKRGKKRTGTENVDTAQPTE